MSTSTSGGARQIASAATTSEPSAWPSSVATGSAGADRAAAREVHELDLRRHVDAEARRSVRADLGGPDRVARVHDDAPARRVDHAAREQLTDRHPQHALAAAAVIAVWVEDAERARPPPPEEHAEPKQDERQDQERGRDADGDAEEPHLRAEPTSSGASSRSRVWRHSASSTIHHPLRRGVELRESRLQAAAHSATDARPRRHRRGCAIAVRRRRRGVGGEIRLADLRGQGGLRERLPSGGGEVRHDQKDGRQKDAEVHRQVQGEGAADVRERGPQRGRVPVPPRRGDRRPGRPLLQEEADDGEPVRELQEMGGRRREVHPRTREVLPRLPQHRVQGRCRAVGHRRRRPASRAVRGGHQDHRRRQAREGREGDHARGGEGGDPGPARAEGGGGVEEVRARGGEGGLDDRMPDRIEELGGFKNFQKLLGSKKRRSRRSCSRP